MRRFRKSKKGRDRGAAPRGASVTSKMTVDSYAGMIDLPLPDEWPGGKVGLEPKLPASGKHDIVSGDECTKARSGYELVKGEKKYFLRADGCKKVRTGGVEVKQAPNRRYYVWGRGCDNVMAGSQRSNSKIWAATGKGCTYALIDNAGKQPY